LMFRYPQGGTPGEDVMFRYYVDQDPAKGGVLDYDGDIYSADGHLGTDLRLRGIDDEDAGVPVYAALDGVVISTSTGAGVNNWALIDHGGGRTVLYARMKNGSVLVSAGDAVRAGQQIGEVGSTGSPGYSNLHFEVQDNGVNVDPFQGTYQPGPSAWVQQPPHNASLGTYLLDFAFSRTTPPSPTGSSMPRTGQIDVNDAWVFWWYTVSDLPANSTWTWESYDPGGNLYRTKSGTYGGNPRYLSSFWYAQKSVSLWFPSVGTWTLRILINGVEMVSAPLEVTSPYDPNFNRAPVTVTPVLDPATPNACQPLSCRVVGDPLVDDLDYDVVSYRYEWKVDGVVVRDVTTAARADQLPSQPAGSTVTVDVTPTDGKQSGTTSSVSAPVLATPLTLDIQRDAAWPGDWLTFCACEGAPSGAVYLYITAVGGVPYVAPLLRGRFDTDGKYVFTATAPPPGLRGLAVDFVAFGAGTKGKVVASNPDSVIL